MRTFKKKRKKKDHHFQSGSAQKHKLPALQNRQQRQVWTDSSHVLYTVGAVSREKGRAAVVGGVCSCQGDGVCYTYQQWIVSANVDLTSQAFFHIRACVSL